jgi:predicted peptidase
MKRIVKLIIVTIVMACVFVLALRDAWDYLQASTLPISFYEALTAHRLASTVLEPDPATGPTPSPTSTAKPEPVGTPTGISFMGYQAYTYTSQGNSLTYYLYIPANYNPAKKYPLVLLLHGGGEKSNPQKTALQNAQVLLGDPYAAVWSADYNAPGNPHIQEHWPCFVLVPQMKEGQVWVNINVHLGSYTQPAQPSIPLMLTKEILDGLQREYSGIDSQRLYITGLSNGGVGTWDAIERWPNYFAAAAPIAGAGDPLKAFVLKNLPIWAFHGSADPTIPVSGSRQMIAAIEAAGGHPRYTEFAGQGHGVWGFVYSLGVSPLNVTGFYPWLFSQHK